MFIYVLKYKEKQENDYQETQGKGYLWGKGWGFD